MYNGDDLIDGGLRYFLLLKNLYFPLSEEWIKGAMGPKHGKLVFAKTKNHEVSPLPLSIIP